MRVSEGPQAAGTAVLLPKDLPDGLDALVLDCVAVAGPVAVLRPAEAASFLHHILRLELRIPLSGPRWTIRIISAASIMTNISFFLLFLFPLGRNDTEVLSDV